jgi:hypothetical protein
MITAAAFMLLAASVCWACNTARHRTANARRFTAASAAVTLFAFIVVEHGLQLHTPWLITLLEHLLAPDRPLPSWPLLPAAAAARAAADATPVVVLDSVTYLLLVISFALLIAGPAGGGGDDGDGDGGDEPPEPPEDPPDWGRFERMFWDEVERQRDRTLTSA